MKPIPYPADTSAKGWRFELDYERIEQSGTWSAAMAAALDGLPLARPLLLAMWYAAWKQVPCGSLPADDRELAGAIGLPSAVFAQYRDVLMRGWWQAEDGRLYHDTMAERVLEMMGKRRSESDRKAAQRARKAADDHGRPTAVPRDTGGTPAESDTSPTDVPRDTNGTTTGLHQESDTDHLPPEEKVSDGAKAPSSSAEPTSDPPESPKPKPAKPRPAAATPEIPPPYGAIVDAYHEVLPEMPRVRLRQGKAWEQRCRAMRTFWRWVLTSTRGDGTRRATNGDEALAWLRGEYFDRVRHSDWLMGRAPPGRGHEGWRCDLDFLLTARGMKAVIERTEVAA